MKHRKIVLLFSFGFILILLLFFGTKVKNVKAKPESLDPACKAMLTEAAKRAGISADNTEWGGRALPLDSIADPPPLDLLWSCEVKFTWYAGAGYVHFSVSPYGSQKAVFDCSGFVYGCEINDFHGNNAWYAVSSSVDDPNDVSIEYQWYQLRDGRGYLFFVDYDPVGRKAERSEVMSGAEAFWAAANEAADALGNTGNNTNGLPPNVPENPTVRDQPQSLGPLATTPIVPLAGALIGTVIGWLVSVAATSGNIFKTVVTSPNGPAQPPSSTAGLDTGKVNAEGFIWSERPWDEAGPGYVSKEEYERTKDFLDRGYKWTKDGWQAREATMQSASDGPTTGQRLTLGETNPNDGSVKPGEVPEIGKANDQGQYWSERPWDEAGPGYVSKEEYERTKDFLERGYKWTKDGWQTPDEIRQSDQWQQNDRGAVDGPDAEWRAKWEAERHALEKNKDELKKSAAELLAATRMIELNHGLEALNQDLLKDNVYVHNPYQGDPIMLWDWTVQTKNTVWDGTFGSRYGSKGLTCQGYVDRTFDKVKDLVGQQYGPDAQVQKIVFEERSSLDPAKGWLNPKAWGDWCDSWISDNHNLIKVILPDGSQWAVDFHQHNIHIPLTRGDLHVIHIPFVDTRVPPPILRPWAEVEGIWKPYLGEHEFIQSITDL